MNGLIILANLLFMVSFVYNKIKLNGLLNTFNHIMSRYA